MARLLLKVFFTIVVGIGWQGYQGLFCITQGKDHKIHTNDPEKRLNKFSIVNNTKSKKKWSPLMAYKRLPMDDAQKKGKPIGKGKVP